MVEPAAAVVVLGCRVLPSGAPSAALARRLAAAARAYSGGLAPLVLVSGGRRWAGHVEARVMQRALLEAGVPASAILVEQRSLCTADNAYFCAELLRTRGVRRAVIATCGWHLARALANFRRCGIEAAAAPGPGEIPVAAPLAVRARERVCAWLDRLALDRRLAAEPE